ncbi:MAG: LytTR family DNA-binding domain-containing protein, partial [Bacteroidota bacterium]
DNSAAPTADRLDPTGIVRRGADAAVGDERIGTEAQLPNHFLRVHRKYIVNRRQVESFATESPHLQLRNGARIAVAKSRQKEVRAQFAGERVR